MPPTRLNELLISAVSCGDFIAALEYLKHGADPNIDMNDETSPPPSPAKAIPFPILRQSSLSVLSLSNALPQIKPPSQCPRTTLAHIAAEQNQPDILDFISRNAPELLKRKNTEGLIPLQVAIKNQALEAFNQLTTCSMHSFLTFIQAQSHTANFSRTILECFLAIENLDDQVREYLFKPLAQQFPQHFPTWEVFRKRITQIQHLAQNAPHLSLEKTLLLTSDYYPRLTEAMVKIETLKVVATTQLTLFPLGNERHIIPDLLRKDFFAPLYQQAVLELIAEEFPDSEEKITLLEAWAQLTALSEQAMKNLSLFEVGKCKLNFAAQALELIKTLPGLQLRLYKLCTQLPIVTYHRFKPYGQTELCRFFENLANNIEQPLYCEQTVDELIATLPSHTHISNERLKMSLFPSCMGDPARNIPLRPLYPTVS